MSSREPDGDFDLPEVAPDELLRLVLQFAATPDLGQARRLVEENARAILHPMADAALQMALTAGRQHGDHDMITTVESRRALLRRCREVGIPRAFDTDGQDAGPFDKVDVSAEAKDVATHLLQFANASSWSASKKLVLAHRNTLLGDDADGAPGVFIDAADAMGDGDAAAALRLHRRLLRRAPSGA